MGQLLTAANMLSHYDVNDELTYLYKSIVPTNWNKEWWEKLCEKPKIERLKIAGALIAAEIDRLNFTSD